MAVADQVKEERPMSNPGKKQPSEEIPVHYPRPGERFVRVEDLVRNRGVIKQINSMAKISRGKTRAVASNKGS